MESVEDIVIVGAGIAGLTASLGLHRLGIRSLVLESSDKLRSTGFALTVWPNAWKALDALGIGDSLRQRHYLILGVVPTAISNISTTEFPFKANGAESGGSHEVRCLQRSLLLETLEKALPTGTIRFSSKLVSIEDSGFFKLVHLADGTVLKTKVLIGCDGVNSKVAKWLGFKEPIFTGRSAVRALAESKSGHDFDPKFFHYFGKGFRSGFMPCDDKTLYWFYTFTPSEQEKDLEENPTKMKQYVLDRLNNVPDRVKNTIETTGQDRITSSPLRYRRPWELLWGNISRGNVCVAGDALHPMTPDIGQGGCSAMEDGVVLARCLGQALSQKPSGETKDKAVEDNEEYKRIEMGLKKYAQERKWRSFDLITTACTAGFIQQSSGMIMNFLRDKVLPKLLARWLFNKTTFDCGKLHIS